MSHLRVLKFFIKSSPVGELSDVLEDLSNIIGTDFLQQPEIKQALRDYYEAHHLQLSLSNGQTVIVSASGKQEPIVRYSGSGNASQPKKKSLWNDEEGEEGEQQDQQEEEESYQQEQQTQEIEEFVYYDPVKRVKFSFHPVTLTAKIEEEGQDQEAQNLGHEAVSLRDDVVEQMNGYLNRQFRKGTTQYSVYSDNQTIKIEISCHNLNFKSFWGGEWLSQWQVDLSSQTLQGSIKIHNHYFEQGNIQFNLNQSFPASKLKALTGREIVDLICKNETNYQEGLEEMYTEVSEKLLKGMRRVMPITRTKFDWNRPTLI